MLFNHAQWLKHVTHISKILGNAGLYSLFFLYAKSKPGKTIIFSVDDATEAAALEEIRTCMSTLFAVTTPESGLYTLGGMKDGAVIDSITYIELITTNLEQFSPSTITTLEGIFERLNTEMFHQRKAKERGITAQ